MTGGVGAHVGGDERRILERPEVAELGSPDQLGGGQRRNQSGAEPRRVRALLVVADDDGHRTSDVRDTRDVQLGLRLERLGLVVGETRQADRSVGEIDEAVVDVGLEHVGAHRVQRRTAGVPRQRLVA